MIKLQKILIYLGILMIVANFGSYIFLNQHHGSITILGILLVAFGLRKYSLGRNLTYSLVIISAVVLALNYPGHFLSIGDFDLTRLIIPLLQLIMFGMGSQTSLEDFSRIFKSPKPIIIGIICQFTVMPLIAFGLIQVFNFPLEIAAGIILVGSSPSGLASNVMSFIAKANIALSVTLTAFATILAPIMTPFLMKIFAGQLIPIDFLGMLLSILNMVILPILAGLIFNSFANTDNKKQIPMKLLLFFGILAFKNLGIYFHGMESSFLSTFFIDIVLFVLLPILLGYTFQKYTQGNREILNKIMTLVSMAGIAIIIVVITAAGRDSLVEIGILLIVACILHNSIGYLLGYQLAKITGLDKKSCRTIALEVGMQNSGLASGIAVQMGKVATLGLAPSIFGPLMNITGSSLATWWKANDEKENYK